MSVTKSSNKLTAEVETDEVNDWSEQFAKLIDRYYCLMNKLEEMRCHENCNGTCEETKTTECASHKQELVTVYDALAEMEAASDNGSGSPMSSIETAVCCVTLGEIIINSRLSDVDDDGNFVDEIDYSLAYYYLKKSVDTADQVDANGDANGGYWSSWAQYHLGEMFKNGTVKQCDWWIAQARGRG